MEDGLCSIAPSLTIFLYALPVKIGEGAVLATAELALFPTAYSKALPLYATLFKKAAWPFGDS